MGPRTAGGDNAAEEPRPTDPAPTYLRSSYQNSPRNRLGSNGEHVSLSAVFERLVHFSFGGYESTTQEECEDEESLPRRKQENRCNSIGIRAVILAIFVLAFLSGIAVLVFGKFLPSHAQKIEPIYTGEAPVCTKEDGDIESLRAFSSVDDVEHGAVAADHPKCSEIGLSILRDLNGNAVDAAVATALCLGIANPSSSGIGGGAFILIHAEGDGKRRADLPPFHDARSKTSERAEGGKITEVIDCREVAGERASTMMFEQEGMPADASLFGGLAVAVPGELRGLELAHARHGRLDWASVVKPAIELARDGVPIYPHLADVIKYLQMKQKLHGGLPSLRRLLTHDDDWNNILKEGELLKNPQLANTLQSVMEKGADAIYTGEIAEQLANEIQQAGGILTKHDLENYFPTLRSPVISDSIFGFRVAGVPPPSSGGAVIIGALRFLKGYSAPLASFAETLSIHRLVEALKHVFAIRMSLADPAFPVVNASFNATVREAVEALIEGPYMEQLRISTPDNTILNLSHYGGPKFAQLQDEDGQKDAKDAKEGDRRRLVEGYPNQRRKLYDPFGYLEDHGTSHFSVIDKDGNAVAITTSVNAMFGAGFVSETTGIVLNNQMDDFGNPGRPDYFGLKPSEANFIKPFKKPLSSMSPTMVFQTGSDAGSLDGGNKVGDLRLVIGGSGGPKIITAVVQVIINHLLLGKPLFDSVAHPRIHNQLIYHGAAATEIENSFASGINLQIPNRTKAALRKRNHPLVEINYLGTVQAVGVDLETSRMTAVCDIRKGGSPVGY